MALFFCFFNIFLIALCASFSLGNLINLELISHLKEYFNSDLILIAIDDENCNLTESL